MRLPPAIKQTGARRYDRVRRSGLSGEIRAVTMPEQRVAEAKKLGFRICVLPAVSKKTLGDTGVSEGMKILGVSSISQVLELL